MREGIWTWEKCKDKIASLRGRLGFDDSAILKFLKLALSLEDGRIYDEIRDKPFPEVKPSVYCILSGYAESKPAPNERKLVPFSRLPGGECYSSAFIKRAIQPIEKTFGLNAQLLWDAARLLDGERLDYGDCSVKVRALPLVPIVIILWGATSEFPASANMLFDSSASNYLSTEQLAMLGELTSARLIHAHEVLAQGLVKLPSTLLRAT